MRKVAIPATCMCTPLGPGLAMNSLDANSKRHQNRFSMKPIGVVLSTFVYLVSEATGEHRSASEIRIVVVSTSLDNDFISAWSPTFETFLNERVGHNLSFKMLVLNMTATFDAVAEASVDFVFASSSLYSCLDVEYAGKSTIRSVICRA
jgi:hypothetical protein